jgi:uncharacterized protein (UPF0548 family)
MYPQDVARIAPAAPPLEAGRVVAPLVRLWGVWALAPCRIVYVVDERDESGGRRYGFAYGTLRGHPESGEERFLVEHRADDTVWYDLLAFSRPNHLLSALALPGVRRLQRRFGRRSQEEMLRAVKSEA